MELLSLSHEHYLTLSQTFTPIQNGRYAMEYGKEPKTGKPNLKTKHNSGTQEAEHKKASKHHNKQSLKMYLKNISATE